MKIETTNGKGEKRYADVQFPIYRKQDTGDSIVYEKTESLNKEISIDLKKDNTFVEININEPLGLSDKSPEKPTIEVDSWYFNYFIGRGKFKSNKEEFDNAIAKAKDIINSIND